MIRMNDGNKSITSHASAELYAELPLEVWDDSSKADEYFDKGYEVLLSGEGDDLFKFLYSRKMPLLKKYLESFLDLSEDQWMLEYYKKNVLKGPIDETAAQNALSEFLLEKVSEYCSSIGARLESKDEINVLKEQAKKIISRIPNVVKRIIRNDKENLNSLIKQRPI